MHQTYLPKSSLEVSRALQQCRKNKDLASLLRLHTHIRENNPDVHASLGNSFVISLVELGSMCHAEHVFKGLNLQDERLWNFLISGYVKHGEPRHALRLFQEMRINRNLHPNEYSFVALLKACTVLKDLNRGIEVHEQLCQSGLYVTNVHIGSALVDMYAKCGSLVKAQEVFHKIHLKNVVSWTSLIAGYVENGYGHEALNCFQQMQKEGIVPDTFTFVCALRACASVGALVQGNEFFCDITQKGFLEPNVFIGSVLVDMYMKCGCLPEAKIIFDKLPFRNVVSWNALISGYADQGYVEEVFSSMQSMQAEGIPTDAFTLACSLNCCDNVQALEKGYCLHSKITKNGFLESDTFIGAALVDMYVKCGSLSEACHVFESLPFQTTVSWNAIISGYTEHGYFEEAFTCFKKMPYKGVATDLVTLLSILKACGGFGISFTGFDAHNHIVLRGLDSEIHLCNTLVDMYSKLGLLAETRAVFNKLCDRSIVSWTALLAAYLQYQLYEDAISCLEQMQLEGISQNSVSYLCSLRLCGNSTCIAKGLELHNEIVMKGLLETDHHIGGCLVHMYCRFGFLEEAHDVFNKLDIQDIVASAALIRGYVEEGYAELALHCFEQMQKKSMSTDAIGIASAINACGSIGLIHNGKNLHMEIVMKGFEKDFVINNSLVDMYAKCGSLEPAVKIFNMMLSKETSLWNVLLTGYSRLGDCHNVFLILEGMVRDNIYPNDVTFLSVLQACNYAGLTVEGFLFFRAGVNTLGLTPTVQHYACLVDLFGRAGLLENAINIVEKMPLHPNSIIWHSFLGSSHKGGFFELGLDAFENAMLLNDRDVAAYVSVSNLYIEITNGLQLSQS